MTDLATRCTNIARKFRQMLADERASTAIEYALVAGGVGCAVAATIYSLGTQVKQQLYDKIAGIFQ